MNVSMVVGILHIEINETEVLDLTTLDEISKINYVSFSLVEFILSSSVRDSNLSASVSIFSKNG